MLITVYQTKCTTSPIQFIAGILKSLVLPPFTKYCVCVLKNSYLSSFHFGTREKPYAYAEGPK
jgi:hypothetical protein